MKYFAPVVFYASIVLCFAQTSTAQISGWKASVVSVSADAPQYVSSPENRKAAGPAYWPGRPAGHRWVTVTVRVTSPSKDAEVPAAKIVIATKDGAYPVTAVGYQAKPKYAVVYLPLLIIAPPHPDAGMKEATGAERGPGVWSTLYTLLPDKRFEPTDVGYFENSRGDKALFRVVLKGEGGGRALVVVKSPLDLVMLFAVPEGSTELQLKFGDAEPVAIPGP